MLETRCWRLDGRLKDVHTGAEGSGNLGLNEEVRPGQIAAIGRNGTESRYWFSGSVDDIAVWRRALSYGEVVQIFEAGTNDVALQIAIDQLERLTVLAAIESDRRMIDEKWKPSKKCETPSQELLARAEKLVDDCRISDFFARYAIAATVMLPVR